MELGSWALIHGPSLLGLIPLVVYIVLSFAIQDSIIIPISIATIVGFIMSGNGAVAFGTQFGTTMGSTMGQVGFLVMLGAGLGGVMSEVGVTKTLCKWIVKGFHIKTKKIALIVLSLTEVILVLFIGSGVTATAIAAPFMIPIAALFGIHPVSMAVIMAIDGFVGMLLSPFASPNIMCMDITGLSFTSFELWAALPLLIVMFVASLVVIFYVEKKYTQNENSEKYELSEEEMNYDIEVSPVAKRATIAFLITFVLCVAYVIFFGGGMAFTFFYMFLLTLIVAGFGKYNLKSAIDTFFKTAASQIQIFYVCVMSTIMIATVDAIGGFDALGTLFAGLVNGGSGVAFTGIFATLVGLFGVSGIAATQQVVIDGLFGGIVQSVGMKMGMYALVLLEGSYLTVLLYPSMTHFSALGLFRSKEMGTLLKACWAIIAVCVIFAIVYFTILGIIF